jgi:uncharacterized protein YicC (UPF0701 family)
MANAFEELKAEVRGALAELKAQLEGSMAEIKAVVHQLGEKVTGLEGKVGEVQEAAQKVYEPSIEKMLDRIEEVEVLLGAPRAQTDDGGDDPDPKAKKGEKKSAREVFGNAIVPAEWRR